MSTATVYFFCGADFGCLVSGRSRDTHGLGVEEFGQPKVAEDGMSVTSDEYVSGLQVSVNERRFEGVEVVEARAGVLEPDEAGGPGEVVLFLEDGFETALFCEFHDDAVILGLD